MESRNFHSRHYVEITVTAREATTFKISVGASDTIFSDTYTINANDSRQIEIPWNLVEPIGSENIEDMGIHLVAEKPVNVYALNWDQNSADVAVIYPIESLGKEYFAMCYYPDIDLNNPETGNGRNSEFLIVAYEDSTLVNITPSKVTDRNKPKDSTFTVLLNKGQVYQVQSENEVGSHLRGQGDLTGSHILADKPVAFYSGSLSTRVPVGECCWDHLYEQIPPVRSWGREFFAAPLKTREQDRYRIIAAEDNTTVQISGRTPFVLNRGEFKEVVFFYDDPKRIFADKPIMVAQFSQSRDVDEDFTGRNGDPFMIILSSVTQSKNDVTFVAYESENIKKYFVNIISLTSEINNIRFNNNNISGEFKPFPDSDYSFAQKEINRGTHRILNTNEKRGFLAYVYGYGGVESYGYGVGFNLDLVLDLGESIDFDGDTLLLCHGESIELDAGPYFDTYDWSTGDSTQKITVTDGGKYYVEVTTIDGCELEDSIFVFVSKPEVDLNPKFKEGCYPYSIELDGNDGFEQYVWQNQDNDTLSNNQFYIASETGEYRLTVYNDLNCAARDTMNLVIFPVPNIEIQGDTLLCGSTSSELLVQITDAPASVWDYEGSYTWSSNKPELQFIDPAHQSVSIETENWGYYEIYYELKTIDNCYKRDTFRLRFHPQPESRFYFEDDEKCEGYSKKLIFDGTATDSADFYWDLDGCQFVDTIIENGIYNVSVGAFLDKQPFIKLVIDDNQCWSDTTIKALGARPNFTMDADNTRGCDELTVNFTSRLLTEDVVDFVWTFGDGEVVESQDVTKHYPDTGFYKVTLTITNPVTQCKNGFTQDSMIKVFPTPIADITADPLFCYPDSADLIYTHNIDSSFCTWSFVGANQVGGENDSVIIVLDEPFATATLIVDEYGCVSSPGEITLKRLPHFDFFTENEEGCQPYSFEVFSDPKDDYLDFGWITDSIPYYGNSINYYLPDSGKFDMGLLAKSNETGCSDTLLKTDWIWVHPKPKADFDVDFPVALLEHADITFTNYTILASSYLWDFGDDETSQETNPIHTYTELGEFNSMLFAQSDFGCLDTAELLIKILPFNVHTPNAFRPNSDIAENRTFMPVGTGADVSRFNLKIYDRWGQLVFETQNPNHPWDGTSKNGSHAPMGNYIWVSHFFDIQGFEHNQKGQVLLIR